MQDDEVPGFGQRLTGRHYIAATFLYMADRVGPLQRLERTCVRSVPVGAVRPFRFDLKARDQVVEPPARAVADREVETPDVHRLPMIRLDPLVRGIRFEHVARAAARHHKLRLPEQLDAVRFQEPLRGQFPRQHDAQDERGRQDSVRMDHRRFSLRCRIRGLRGARTRRTGGQQDG